MKTRVRARKLATYTQHAEYYYYRLYDIHKTCSCTIKSTKKNSCLRGPAGYPGNAMETWHQRNCY